jgi:putative ABC transport system permease protein
VNETLARRYIVGSGDLEKALGHNLRLRDHDHVSIVGVVKDSNYGNIGGPAVPVFYMSYGQMGKPMGTLHVRTEGDPTEMVSRIRGQLGMLDRELAPVSVLTLAGAVSSQGLFMPRVSAILGGAFGLVALLLAVIGLYGVVSFLVGRRTQEIGVRIALGAQRSSILRMILGNGIALAAMGLMIGTAGAYLLTPWMGNLLIGIGPRDPEVFLGIALLLITAALGASWIPARRATEIDPIEALRCE